MLVIGRDCYKPSQSSCASTSSQYKVAGVRQSPRVTPGPCWAWLCHAGLVCSSCLEAGQRLQGFGAGSALAGDIARWGGVAGRWEPPPPLHAAGCPCPPLHLVPALQRVFLLEVELNASLGLIADSTAGFLGVGANCRLASPSTVRCDLWAQRMCAVAKPGAWVGAGGAGGQRPTWKDAGGGSLASSFTLALEERDIPVSLGYWCSWEPLGRCPKCRGKGERGVRDAA